jgi:hypothetical protein
VPDNIEKNQELDAMPEDKLAKLSSAKELNVALSGRNGRRRSKWAQFPCKVLQGMGARSAHSFAKKTRMSGAPAVWLRLGKPGPPA